MSEFFLNLVGIPFAVLPFKVMETSPRILIKIFYTCWNKNCIIQTKKLKCCLKVWIFPTLILYRKEICCRCSSGLYCGNRSISDGLSVPPRFINSKLDVAYVPLFLTKQKHTGSPLKQYWDLDWWLFLRHIMRNCTETAAEPIILLTFNILNICPTLHG